jgi:NAD(P)-dependent dehydrogenase (short-subunit alcohol dehydrogenase family)
MATIHGKAGVRCNTIVSGYVLTRPEHGVAERLNVWFQNQHSCRLGEPEDVANVVVFLASDECRYFQAALGCNRRRFRPDPGPGTVTAQLRNLRGLTA